MVMRSIVVGLLCDAAPYCRAATHYDLKKDFAMLDTVVANMDGYMDAWQKHIDGIKMKDPFPSEMDRYMFYKHKFLEHVKFCSDSAIAYAQLCEQTAARVEMKEERQESNINLIYAIILQGNYLLADSLMKRLSPIEELPESLRWHAAMVHLEFNIRVAPLYNTIPEGNMLDKLYALDLGEVWHQYGPYLAAGNWMSDYYEALCKNTVTRQRLSARLDSVNKPSVEAAMLSLALAKKCKAENDSNAFCHYLIQSAANDIMSANRESSSLIMLLHTPFIDTKSQRAVKYAMSCIKMANGYNDIARSLDIIKANSIVITEYMDTLEKMIYRRKAFLVLLAFIVIMAAVSLYLAGKKLHGGKNNLSAVIDRNMHLRNALAELTNTHKELENSVANRDVLALEMFVKTSDYIGNVKKFAKTVDNMLVTGQPGKARKALENGCTDKFLPYFYESFDKWFLSVHPDFIERFAKLLKPEEREHFSHPQAGLSPELRIYALVSLGMTDSVSIANFLHYSPQTIYNYRMRMRHCALIGGKNFAAAVASMYKPDGTA